MTIDQQLKKVEDKIRKLYQRRRKLMRLNLYRDYNDRVADWQNKLRGFIEKSEYNQSDVARKVGVSKFQMCRYVRMRNRIPKSIADKIIKLLNVENY